MNIKIISLLPLVFLSAVISTHAFGFDSQDTLRAKDVLASLDGQPTPDISANDQPKEGKSFLSRVDWKLRLGVTDFRVEDLHTFGIGAGLKGLYETEGGIRLKLLITAIVDFDTDHLDSDHIPVWFKSYFKAEKELLALGQSVQLLGTGDFEHKMNTVSSIEQSADLMAGLKLQYASRRAEVFARFGAGGYYLEIDDDLPQEYSDYRREDLSSGELAWFQEYKCKLYFADRFSISARYKNFRSSDIGSLETREELKLAYQFSPAKQFVLKVEKTRYNLDQFERSAGDNGLEVLPFDEDTYYQAYLEFDFF